MRTAITEAFLCAADEKLTAFLELESAIRADQRLAARIG